MLITWCLLKFLLHVLCVCVFQGHEAGQGHTELESLQQENEVLKAQMARLSTQLLDVRRGTNFSPLILVVSDCTCVVYIGYFLNI